MARAHQPPRSVPRRLAPLLLALFLPAGLVDSHELHVGGAAEATVYPDARHAGQADHWDAAEQVEVRRCPDCLAPAKHRGLLPARAAGPSAPEAVGQALAELRTPPGPAWRQAGAPRAPPLA